MGHLVPLWREKKTIIYFGRLHMSFESNLNFTEKIPSLLTLIASIVFNNSIRVIGLVNEM